MPPPTCMQEGRCVFFLAMIVVLLLPSANGDHVFEHQAELRSALTVDVDCLFLDNLTCEFEQAQHTLDYFSADWCGPCVDVDYTLSELNQENLSVLLHPVSFEDETYSYDSILLFEETYRLLIIPSVIVNGETLYTGSRQTDDLSVGINATESLKERTNISIQNKTIMFQLDDDEMIEIWYAEPSFKSRSNETFFQSISSTTRSTSSEIDITESFQITSDGRIFVYIWKEGQRNPLQIGSEASTAGFEFLNIEFEQEQLSSSNNPLLIPVIVGGFMFLMLYPSLVLHLKTMHKGSPDEEE